MKQRENIKHIVVEEGANPSSDYFVRPFLSGAGADIVRCSFAQLPSADLLDGAIVTFVRYVPRKWRQLIERHQGVIQQLNFFMDDDLFSWPAFARMPLRYQWKLLRLSWRHQAWLRAMGAKLLVSTPYLQQRYAEWQPQLLAPQVPAGLLPLLGREDVENSDSAPITVFYHGSASHGADLNWLRPVIEKALAADKRLVFEVIGNNSVNRLFKGLPRAHVIHPMKWGSYQALLQRPGRTIGLAPLLDSPFNRARSHTKFLDITLAGAVGIFARGPVYGEVVRDGENGLLLPMDQAAWVEGILRLASDAPLRNQLLCGARACL
ncbi:glycosyltransferase family 1 protein [Microbulbifer sp. YPW1]|uniref:glycosyltransferase family 1 protein n=1 Tax=Microbulbifer sp. YPW1 TaxID=2745199 RepID=UPI001599AC0C|nr:glycosyltransferase family 1 protein [Microbulbifer sp. YPW1]QKX15823.1 glycosyltransferase family 1 protein [Microbulbifer sp. YPW1]